QPTACGCQMERYIEFMQLVMAAATGHSRQAMAPGGHICDKHTIGCHHVAVLRARREPGLVFDTRDTAGEAVAADSNERLLQRSRHQGLTRPPKVDSHN